MLRRTIRPQLDDRLRGLRPEIAGSIRREISPEVLRRLRPAPAGPTPPPQPQREPPVPGPAAPPAPAVAGASASNPLDDLPFPQAGQPILADHFRALSESLLLIRDALSLSGALFGHSFDEAKRALVSQGYGIERVMSVFGTEIDALDDLTLDNRRVIQVTPVDVGEPGVMVVVTEVSETRRFAPTLKGLSYNEAQDRVRARLGDVPGAPFQMPNLAGLTIGQAQDVLARS